MHRRKARKLYRLIPAGEDFSQQPNHKIPHRRCCLGQTIPWQVMQDEIFGPLMPVKGYGTVDETLDYINDHPRPLGLYYFGGDSAEEHRVLTHTTSGGVTVNDVIMHVAQEELAVRRRWAFRYGLVPRRRWLQGIQSRQIDLHSVENKRRRARRATSPLRRKDHEELEHADWEIGAVAVPRKMPKSKRRCRSRMSGAKRRMCVAIRIPERWCFGEQIAATSIAASPSWCTAPTKGAVNQRPLVKPE